MVLGSVCTEMEADLWSRHGIVLGQKEFQFEDSSLEGGALRSSHHHVEVSGIAVVWDRGDAWDWLLHQSLGLLDDPPG